MDKKNVSTADFGFSLSCESETAEEELYINSSDSSENESEFDENQIDDNLLFDISDKYENDFKTKQHCLPLNYIN